MATVIRDTIIVTSDADGRIIYDGAIAIGDDGNIAAVGSTDEVVRTFRTQKQSPRAARRSFPVSSTATRT